MDKKTERIFVVLAVTGVALGAYAVIRCELVLRAFNHIADGLEEFATELKFAEIVEHYDDEGEN